MRLFPISVNGLDHFVNDLIVSAMLLALARNECQTPMSASRKPKAKVQDFTNRITCSAVRHQAQPFKLLTLKDLYLTMA